MRYTEWIYPEISAALSNTMQTLVFSNESIYDMPTILNPFKQSPARGKGLYFSSIYICNCYGDTFRSFVDHCGGIYSKKMSVQPYESSKGANEQDMILYQNTITPEEAEKRARDVCVSYNNKVGCVSVELLNYQCLC